MAKKIDPGVRARAARPTSSCPRRASRIPRSLSVGCSPTLSPVSHQARPPGTSRRHLSALLNAGRSQIAAALANYLHAGVLDASSAGLNPDTHLSAVAAQVFAARIDDLVATRQPESIV